MQEAASFLFSGKKQRGSVYCVSHHAFNPPSFIHSFITHSISYNIISTLSKKDTYLVGVAVEPFLAEPFLVEDTFRVGPFLQ